MAIKSRSSQESEVARPGLAQTEEAATRLIPVVDWAKHHTWPPIGGLRHLIFFAADNGADAWVRRVGRRVLVDERAFFNWVEEQHGRDKAQS